MTEEQQALLAKARRSLNAARRLSADGDLDFAVSRAYYSCFYTAQAFLIGRGLRFSKHSAVIAAFGREFAREEESLREFHYGLIEAENARIARDYEIEVPISTEDIQAHLDRAARFIQREESSL
jgi:uncharacterized protein (UPF0332 family)